MSFRLTREAQTDVENIYRYTYETFGEGQADTYHEALFERFEGLDENPLMGRDYSELRPHLRRLEHRSHSIYYRVDDQGILILRILHSSMDPARHF